MNEITMQDPGRLAGGEVFLVVRNTFEGPWRERLTPVKITKTYPRAPIDADCVVVRAFLVVPVSAFDALDAGDVYVNDPENRAWMEAR